MLDESNCRGLLERILEIPIGSIEIDKEKSIVYRPEFKGVRLDVYAKEDNVVPASSAFFNRRFAPFSS